MIDKTKHEKIEALEKASKILKSEFVGLDDIIEEIITSFKSWYVTPEVNERPSVISLFGMTGTGKTSLIRRLIEILSLEHKTLFFDCGTESNDGSQETVVDKISKFLNMEDSDSTIEDLSKDLIFVFDEFQYSRTIDESGTEVQKSNLRSIWELVDHGTLNLSINDWELSYLFGFIEDLKSYATSCPGIKLNNKGEITDPKDIESLLNSLGFFYYDRGVPGIMGAASKWGNHTETELKDIDNPCSKPLRILEERAIRIIVRKLNNHCCTKYLNTMKDLLSCGTLDELCEKLESLYPSLAAPKTIKCPKALVIILGNIDEAFKVEGNITPDLDADIFYDETSKVTINDIKEALKKRFRAEQIARLGNTIIKYPTLKGKDFKEIIEKETTRILQKFEETEGIKVSLDPSILELLYSEGVYPAQGVRPVFTTISSILTPLLSDILLRKPDIDPEKEVIINAPTDSRGFNVPEIHIEIKNNGRDFGRDIKLSLGSLRDPGSRKTRYINSVHEIGHAIMISYLTGKIPNSIVSVSSSGGGFCTSYDPEKVREIDTKRDIKNSIMISFGGYEAEKLIFGDPDSVLMGSHQDIEDAWKTLSDVAYEMGYFGSPFRFSNFDVEDGCNIPEGMSDESLRGLITSEFLDLQEETKRILGENKNLLLRSSIVLGESGKITGTEFRELVKKYGSTLNEARLEEAIKLNSPNYYLDQIKKELGE